MLGARAVALQMTDPALSRRGLRLADKRRWHSDWRVETQGFGLAGLVGLIVPFANLLLGPALVTGGTLLVLEPRARARRERRPLQADAARLALADGLLRLGERRLELERVAVAVNGDRDLRAALGARHRVAQVVAVGDRVGPDLRHDVAGL